MKTNEIRNVFLTYFKDHGHTIVPSSSLIPHNDQTLLFTNAGMVPFKDVFIGREKRSYTRATSVQCCMRASGKHNDLEQVGFTARHHTFFEMLGNFSFGDYFKREAIKFAWDFLTKELKIPQEKLWVTVYKEDQEAEDIWFKDMKIDPNRFSRCGEKDNFWAMGATGPCGPCSEIFYDHGESIPGGPPGSPDEEGDRFVEIWNLVFMQYNRDIDGQLNPLPKPSVDTGMGLERLAAVLQGVHSNYDIDLFQYLMKAAAEITHCDDLTNPSLKVLADHIRASAFLIKDGVMPSNEGAGYVLRRIIRRAIRHGNKLGVNEPFFYRMVESLVAIMGDAYPDLKKSQKVIEKLLLQEEEQFDKTLQQGMKLLEGVISGLSGKVISGDVVFKLYDTYGFPVDLTAVIAKEQGLSIDEAGFDREMAKQRAQSQAASQFVCPQGEELHIEQATEFRGYDSLVETGKILAIFHDNHLVDELHRGERGGIVLDFTPFYAESGGQIGDQGKLEFPGGEFDVRDTQKTGDAIVHIGELKSGTLKINEEVTARVNYTRRQAIRLNHSATHLLHAALRETLGEHVMQKGSLVAAEHLRFDFSHFQLLTAEELQLIENKVNDEIRANYEVQTRLMDIDNAIAEGATALFGEKYAEKVRVLSMGNVSKELCGGTHVERTGDIGLFKIISESSVASGVRRIEAITGHAALEFVAKQEALLSKVSHLLKSSPEQLPEKIVDLLSEQKDLEKQLSVLKAQSAKDQLPDMLKQAKEVNGLQLLVATVDITDINTARKLLDQLKDKLQKAVVVLALQKNKSVNLLVGVTKNCTDKVHAGELVRMIAEQIGGKGGGRPDMAQGGGDRVDALAQALTSVESWIKNKLN